MCFLIMDMFEDIIIALICKDAKLTKNARFFKRREREIIENGTGNDKRNVRKSL